MAVNPITEVSASLVDINTYLRSYRIANVGLKDQIDTSDLAVGSNILVADSTAAFFQWDGSNWNEVL